MWIRTLPQCLAIALLGSCGNLPRSPVGGAQPTCLPVDDASMTCWKLVLPLGSGGFPPEPGSNDSPKWEPGRWPLTLQPIIAFDDDLWMLSQTHAWSSSDGVTWTHYPKTDWDGRIWHEIVFFQGQLWMFGGLHYADRTLVNDIWSSRDGVTWEKAGNAAWSPRARHRVIAFRDKLWLFGGLDRVRPDFTTEHQLNDIWTSDDGVHWTELTASAPFAPREDAKLVAIDDGLLLLGAQGRADVWRSPDGVAWTQLSTEAEYGARQDFAVLWFRGRIWVYGGWRGRSTDGLNDIWYSADGSHFTQQTEHAPWGPRSPRTIVYKDRLWIFSGKHTGASDNWGGDVWAMSAGDGS